MQPLYVPLSPDARERLREMAALERRSPRQQAAIILERALGSKVPEPKSGDAGQVKR